eukprot:CAMPEP_0202697618 /NCGR_PEP_ID=MMETSP1385-20130828/10941_1 /ASSEMBLY_ACC=CAM_ASM_000861 /TAXON_ID=933848 /ORGANISM="Elphidium margaritaceum" /LENGTH=481 /DNA_ID=CAMNT_0049354119 /DNA_START=104 /DNA_END=1549 /DNA_ORIENTATION=-
MTTNPTDTVAANVAKLSVETGNNGNKSKQSDSISQSHSSPNLGHLKLEKQNVALTDADSGASLSSSAYNYASSTISGAYNYVSSSIYTSATPTPASTQTMQAPNGNSNNNNNNNQQWQPQTRVYSQSMSELPKNGHKNNSNSKSKPGKTAPPPPHQSAPPLPGITADEASVPDLQKYPMDSFGANDACNSNLCARTQQVSSQGIHTTWAKQLTQPSPDTVPLRSLTYKTDGKKEVSGDAVFKLVHAQAFKTDIMIDHVAMHPMSWFNQNIGMDDMSCFTLIVHLQVKSIKTSFISYHVLERERIAGYNANGTPIVKNDKAMTKLLDLVLNATEKTIQNNRFKLIPRIVEGPYPVKRVVENRPVLLGNKVSHSYFRGANYFEIDSRVDESMVAASIIKLAHRFAKRIVVDMAWTLQGETEDELPERMLCGVTVHNMEFSKCKDIKSEMEHCHKLVYPKKDDNNAQKNGNNNNAVNDECKQEK